MNLASVYRSLGLFAELGLARESHTGDDAGEWELSHPDDRFHVVCDSCGRVDHHGGAYVEEIRSHLQSDHGFEASGRRPAGDRPLRRLRRLRHR